MSFKKIIGQEKAINFLLQSIKNNKLASSYLFIGPEGVGKALVAQEFAKLLNCQKDNLDACDSCSSCLKIDNRNHPDIHWLEKNESGVIKIEDIRQLGQEINLKPYEAKKKVFIINEAHAMNAEASNALLKTLEEPPKDSILILTTNSAERMFSTIVSRCQKVFFSSINIEELKLILERDYHLKVSASHYLARFTEGRLGKSLSLKDIDILSEKNRIIDNFVSARHTSDDFFDLETKDKQAIKYNLDILLNWFRDILLLKCGIEAGDLVNSDRSKELLNLEKQYNTDEILKTMEQILNTYTMLEYNLNPKIFLEFLKVKAWKD
ncbi:MAG: DNA polymerase III subunit delta' [Candidatus Omnitrophica bacterium]|nr:DNA polymerase III subunit delta' [Candidatus Omnitrophota bacterium]